MPDDLPRLGLSRGTVQLVAADARWPHLFCEEAARLEVVVRSSGLEPLAFEHVGSTAVPGLVAKPILDFMAGHPPMEDPRPYVEALAAAGYEPRGPQGAPDRELLVLGPESRRTHHLNLVERDSAFWRDHIAFRDMLRAEPRLAAAYQALKLALSERHPLDRGAYTAGKAAFVLDTLRRLG